MDGSPLVRWLLGATCMLAITTGTATAQTKTAQSAMFDNTAAGTFVITGEEVWEYDKDEAATHFVGALVSGPTVGCTGASANINRGCNPAYQPATPTAPDAAPVPNSNVNGTVGPNSCNFWEGTELVVNDPHSTYTKSVDVEGLTPASGNAGTWKFTWTYSYTVTGDNPPAPKTAWDLQDNSTTAADVGIAGFFAGQSTQLKNNGSGGWSFKASHTMLDSLGASRLVGATATISDDANAVICTLPIVTNVVSGQDFEYLGNAGRNGNVGNLFDDGNTANGTVNQIQGGVSVALNGRKDDFAGNNGTGGDMAVIDSDATGTCSISTAGSYTLAVTGTLKGVSGASSLPISVTSNLCISAGTCSLCPQ
jgi:hypothetical protein